METKLLAIGCLNKIFHKVILFHLVVPDLLAKAKKKLGQRACAVLIKILVHIFQKLISDGQKFFVVRQ
jgi:hypothetical protein